MWWHEGMDTGSWILMGLAMVVLWSLVVVAVAALYRGDRRDSDQCCSAASGPEEQGVEEPLSRAGGGADPHSSHHPSLTR